MGWHELNAYTTILVYNRYSMELVTGSGIIWCEVQYSVLEQCPSMRVLQQFTIGLSRVAVIDKVAYHSSSPSITNMMISGLP
jgi:hypothetical protein